ncbi:MAG: tRNA (guanosine(46)-N7)-methyltransferase TrmB [Synechococcales cyanobacterium RM1_1_8]|nr:tRNA (guanosine(46)-N7)-methyltransferase TrmB [Synechococcales cyanobacterium RM1_1_8]
MAVVRRVRQHVNPFAIKYQTPVAPPDWSQVFDDPTRPLHLDIGCARGQFLQGSAPIAPDWNFLGLEIRQPLVEAALKQRDEMGLGNLHFIFCNINNSLAPLLGSLPAGVLQRVSIQFPDPWFKKRHQKRRVTQPELVQQLADGLPVGGTVFLQSDVLEVEVEMCDRFSAHPNFQRRGAGWLAENPMAVPTERERVTQAKGEPVYRALFERCP